LFPRVLICFDSQKASSSVSFQVGAEGRGISAALKADVRRRYEPERGEKEKNKRRTEV
jgi:hypothetical protein